MIFRGKTDSEKELELQKLCEWHKWFAWYPVAFDNKVAWLSFIERKFYPKRLTRSPDGYSLTIEDEMQYREISKEELFKQKFKKEIK